MSKYKFALAKEIKEFIEWQLVHYHEDKRQLEQFKADMVPSCVPRYSLTGGTSKGSVSNPTESTAIRMATNPYILMTEIKIHAIDRTLSTLDDTDKRLIDLVYWKHLYTIAGAGMKINLSKTAAYDHVNRILGMIALEMGYVNI